MNYCFFFSYFLEKYLQLRLKQKHLLRELFDSSHAGNPILLLRNWFSNNAYLKYMYITLKEIEKTVCIGGKNFANL